MNKKLLITIDFPPLTGGVANYYRDRIKKMNSDEIVVLTDKNILRKENKKWNEKKAYYKKIFCKIIWPHWLPMVWHIIKISKKEKINELWVGQILPVGGAVKIANFFLGLPYTVTCHGNDLLRAKKIKRKFILAKNILQNAKKIEANTKFTKNILIQDYKIQTEKIDIIYPENTLKKEMLDKEKIKELAEKYNLQDKKVLLSVGRLVESKGFDKSLEAFAEAKKEIPNLVYLIIGSGEMKNELNQKIKKMGLEKSVKLLGEIPHQELPNYYALANVFVMTPRKNRHGDTESYGIVYLEALQFGIPVIAGKTGGIEEIIDEEIKGVLVNSENLQEIKNAIIKILK
jgi:phosphatidylinositol alpha-1,6-mannosyltransferase